MCTKVHKGTLLSKLTNYETNQRCRSKLLVPRFFIGPLLLLLAFCIVPDAWAQAQQASVNGIVQNEKGEGLSGVTIEIKNDSLNYKVAASSDSKGLFAFSDLKPHVRYVLSFSFVGYETHALKNYVLQAGEKASVLISLKQSVADLQDVVVVGYGTAKRINVTGAIDQISGKRLAERPIANVFQGLQGISPGLNITYGGGQPGQTPTINVRGFTSVNGGSPLIVIDGIAAATDDLLRLNPAIYFIYNCIAGCVLCCYLWCQGFLRRVTGDHKGRSGGRQAEYQLQQLLCLVQKNYFAGCCNRSLHLFKSAGDFHR